ncbi:MAG: FGGY family carbohydrate kinase [Eisenbergiella sp.]
MDCFLSVSDYLLYCFTGERLMEESLACRTMLYNIHERKWDDELTELAGAAGRFPRVTGQGRLAGFNKGYGAALRPA